MVYTQALGFGHGLSVIPEEDNLAGMLRNFVRLFRSDTENFAAPGTLRKAMSSSSLGSECSLEEEDLGLQRDMIKRIEKSLVIAKKTSLQCHELLLPTRMTARVSGDIIRASVDEPCGLRGALIHLFMENKGHLHKLGTVTPDHSLTPTFELSVVFRLDRDGWPPLKHFFANDKVLRLRPEYQLVKRKLYSSAKPTVLESY
ncbi:DNA damage-inducible transcript 4-like protein [Brachyhypopomus gauderio]|uniref:DNA damage-inducible transcript 4-like protein n=1 Tax=Brachyhypopomus gauderio TaxID=698409 RepID=UPI00404147FA